MINRIKLAKALLKFQDITTVDGIVITVEGELAVGKEVFTTNENGEIVPLANGNYEVAQTIVVVEGGIVTEIKEKDINEPEETPQEEPTTEETPTEEKTSEMQDEQSQSEKDIEIENLKAENESLKAKIAELESALEKAKEPIAEPIEDVFAKQEKETENKSKIDFTKYIRKNK